MKSRLLWVAVLVAIIFSISDYRPTKAAGTFPAPRYCTVSGASQYMTIPTGGFVWGNHIETYDGTNILIYFPNGGKVTVSYGCVESIPNTTLLGRKTYLDSTYKTSFTCYVGRVRNDSCSGVIPTATKTLPPTKTLVVTKTPTRVVTATASRTATLTRTATPITSIRVDVRHDGITKFIPKIGDLIWCRKFGSETNTIRKITINHFFYVNVTDCGLQNKQPYINMDQLETYLETTTKENWSIVN